MLGFVSIIPTPCTTGRVASMQSMICIETIAPHRVTEHVLSFDLGTPFFSSCTKIDTHNVLGPTGTNTRLFLLPWAVRWISAKTMLAHSTSPMVQSVGMLYEHSGSVTHYLLQTPDDDGGTLLSLSMPINRNTKKLIAFSS